MSYLVAPDPSDRAICNDGFARAAAEVAAKFQGDAQDPHQTTHRGHQRFHVQKRGTDPDMKVV